ncbi:MAG TPA: hypothetical protein VL563_12740 [Gemmatimonadales bacterium]|jgi:hypothetical protein|nr:hypothetical protein [Gemmatimonadales bacterium]
MSILRRAAIWTVAIELPLGTLALLSTIPALYRTVPLVLTAHLPGIAVLDGLHMCCGITPPRFEPPIVLSVLILALANAVVIFVTAWVVLLLHARASPQTSTLRNPGN